MTSAKFLNSEECAVHPAFGSEEGSVALQSNEHTLYYLPPYVLRSTSGLFRRTLQDQNEAPGEWAELEPILIDTKDVILERLLRLISGLETPKWDSFDEIDAVLSLAYEWDAPGPISVIRSAITSPALLKEPLRLFVLASRFGWEEEAKLASTLTLSLQIYDDQHDEHLRRLPTRDLLKLLALHRRRRDNFKARLDSEERFSAGNAANLFCSSCGEKLDNHTWRELKAKMFYEMDQRPLGDTLFGIDMEEWPESIACWDARCRNSECKKLNYNKLVTLRDIRTVLDQLPTTI